MSARHRALALVLLGSLLVAGCGPAEPTATSGPATATQIALGPTDTPLPPTATSAPPTAAQVLIPPIATAAPTVAAAPTTPHTRIPTPTTAPYDKIPEQIDDGWEVASLVDVGINPTWIDKMLNSIYRGEQSGEMIVLPNGELKYRSIHDILIVKDGRLAFEEYFYFNSRYSTHEVASITKSITSLLVGLAIEQGYLSGVDEKILSYFPEYLPLKQPNEQVENITIKDLLTMRSGWECDDWDPASRTYMEKDPPLDQGDYVETILNFPMEDLPGSHFSYCTSGTYVLNALLTKATGMRLSSFAEQHLLEPLGIQAVTWAPSWGGRSENDGILSMRPRDMAKIGLLVLQSGNWNGEQIIPEEWIRLSTQEHVSLESDQPSWGRGYGYLWWLGDIRIIGTRVQSFNALGGWQQVIAIFPELNMVVVINGGDLEEYLGQPFEIMEEFILPSVLGY